MAIITLTKEEVIKKLNLTETKTKCRFHDEKKEYCESIYTNNNGWSLYTFYNGTLYSFCPHNPYAYRKGVEVLDGKLGAGYIYQRLTGKEKE